MSKGANPGEFRTLIEIKRKQQTQDAEGFPIIEWENVFGDAVRCKWVNAHGQEVYENMRLDLREPATLTMRFSAMVTPECIICKRGDPQPYEIISLNDVLEQHRILEIRVQRKVKT